MAVEQKYFDAINNVYNTKSFDPNNLYKAYYDFEKQGGTIEDLIMGGSPAASYIFSKQSNIGGYDQFKEKTDKGWTPEDDVKARQKAYDDAVKYQKEKDREVLLKRDAERQLEDIETAKRGGLSKFEYEKALDADRKDVVSWFKINKIVDPFKAEEAVAALSEAEVKSYKAQFDERSRQQDAIRFGGETLPRSQQSVIKALEPGETLGGTRIVTTTPAGTYFVDATQAGPKISVAQGQDRSMSTATNITPIVEYKTVPEQTAQYGQATGLQAKLLQNAGGDPNNVVTGYVDNPLAGIINPMLVQQAQDFQKSITSQLLGQIFDKTATQTAQPVYSFNETGLTSTNPVTPPEYPKDELSKQIESQTKFLDSKAVEAEQKRFEEAKQNKATLDAQAKATADLETKRIADAKAAEQSRLRGAQKFEYDSQIEAALRAAEGNNPRARKQLAEAEARQKIIDAESLNITNEKKGNPNAYAGGFAEQAIQKTMQTPADFKIPSFAKPRSAPIVPTANELTASNTMNPSSLLPKLEGLQFGGN